MSCLLASLVIPIVARQVKAAFKVLVLVDLFQYKQPTYLPEKQILLRLFVFTLCFSRISVGFRHKLQ